MDPFSIVAGLALTAGALFIDIRGADLLKQKIEHAVSEQAKKTTIVLDQPTEKFTIDFSKKA